MTSILALLAVFLPLTIFLLGLIARLSYRTGQLTERLDHLGEILDQLRSELAEVVHHLWQSGG